MKRRSSIKRLQRNRRKFVKLCEPMRDALAARRIGELVPPEQGKRTDKLQITKSLLEARQGKPISDFWHNKEPHRESVKSIISQQRLSEFRKLVAGMTQND